MAGKTVRPASIGVGPALRRAREIGGTTLEEAARDTKLTVEQLEGLEGEDFELLGEEVYVRAMLRTYAQYLGLKPDKVMSAYARHVDDPEPPPPPAKMGRVEQALAAARIRDNQRFLLIAASVVLLAAGGGGGGGGGGGAPPPAAIPTATAPLVAPTPATGVAATVNATAGVEVTAQIDGAQQRAVSLGPGESISFMASERLVLSTSDGGAVTIVLNGHDLGIPGTRGEPWSHTYVVPQAPASP